MVSESIAHEAEGQMGYWVIPEKIHTPTTEGVVVRDCLAAILKGKCCGKWYSALCNMPLSVRFSFFRSHLLSTKKRTIYSTT